MKNFCYLYKVSIRHSRKNGALCPVIHERHFINSISEASILHDYYLKDGSLIVDETIILVDS